MNLTDHQRRAVERSGQDVCVVAGPGSGKTRVLIERFAWLVESARIDPARILAVTFTEKAANEIKERLIVRFTDRPELRESIERAWVSTIHGFCARLLREHAIAAALPPDFSVLQQAPADRMAREAAEQAIDELLEEQPALTRRLLESLDLSTQDEGPQPDLARSLLDVFDAMRLSGERDRAAPPVDESWIERARELARAILRDPTAGNTSNQRTAHADLRGWAREFLDLASEQPLTVNLGALVKNSAARVAASELKNEVLERVEAERLSLCHAPLGEMMIAMIARIEQRYREKKRAQSALDFDDLEEETIRLLESDEAVRNQTARRFDEILMDELQDTNRLQWRLLNLLRRRLFAVGDVNQSIFGFRHAEPAVFHEYRAGLADRGAPIDELRDNHRSFEPILTAVARVLDGAPGIEPRELIAVRGAGPAVERYVGLGEDAEEVEAALVAARICELRRQESREFRDFAVLLRALTAAKPFERAFDRFRIPFLVCGGRTFLEAREIRDVMALLAALVNPLDEIALVGVLRSPLVGMSDEEIFRIGREKWREHFEKLFGELRRMADFAAPDLIVSRALDECGYAAGLAERARANIEKFLAWLRREWSARPRPLAEMLEDAEALRAQQSEAEAPPPDALNAVRILSIHAAKGLEFPVVFVSAMHRRPNERKPVIVFSPRLGLGAKWRNPAELKGRSDSVHMQVIAEMKRKEEQEENRLLYVAMTRARDRLILSHAETRRPAAWVKMAESIPATLATAAAPAPQPFAAARPDEVREQVCDPPAVSGQFDSTAAVTAVAMFHACPRKYFLSTIAIQESREIEDEIPTGIAAHRILAGEEIDAAEARMLAENFRASELGRRSERASRIEREFDFMLAVEDVVLRGQIDLWFEESGELIVVDYKTDRDESSLEQHAVQLRLYALALARYAGRLPDRAILVYLRSGREIDIGLSEERLTEARATVADFREAQEQMEFPLRPGEQCRRCEYLGRLCAGFSEP